MKNHAKSGMTQDLTLNFEFENNFANLSSLRTAYRTTHVQYLEGDNQQTPSSTWLLLNITSSATRRATEKTHILHDEN